MTKNEMKNAIKVERETFEMDGKQYFSYFIKGTVRGRNVKAAVVPPDKGGYAVLDIVFDGAMEAELVLTPYEMKDDKGKTIKGETYSVRSTDENGEVYECKINAFLVQYSSVLTLESSSPNGKILFNKTFDDSNAQKNSCGIKIYAQGTLNISANVVLENNVYVEGLLKTAQNGSTVNMNGGELIVYNSYAHMAQSGTFNMNGGKITLKSATNDGYSTAFYLMGTKLYLNGGTVEGTGYVYEEKLGFTITQDENSNFSYNTTGGLKK